MILPAVKLKKFLNQNQLIMSEAIKKLEDYNEGDVFRGEKITTLYSAQPKYLIFEGNDSGEVTLASSDDAIKKNWSHISAPISTISGYLTTQVEKKKYVDQIGLAYKDAAEGNLVEAREICDEVLKDIKIYKGNVRKGRFYYLLSCLGMVFLVILFSYFLKEYNLIEEITPYFYYMTYASIGGFLSVSRNIKKLEIDASEFGWFQVVYGAIRILIAMFSGLIIFVLIKSELLLPKLNSPDNFYVVSLLAIAAGFSESLVPNLLNRVETEKLKGE